MDRIPDDLPSVKEPEGDKAASDKVQEQQKEDTTVVKESQKEGVVSYTTLCGHVCIALCGHVCIALCVFLVDWQMQSNI